MNIIAKIPKSAKERQRAKNLYISAFPKEERLPWWILRALTINKNVSITSYYDKDTFCGFTHSTIKDDILFVMFFAVDEERRGKGYGSAILECIKRSNPDKKIMLNVELLDESAANYADRVRRMNFYKKNGFFDTKHNIDEVGGTFRVLSTSQNIDKEKYVRVFMSMTLGLWKPPIVEVEE